MMPICFPRSGANFCDSRTSSPVWTRPAREFDLWLACLVVAACAAAAQAGIPPKTIKPRAQRKGRREAGGGGGENFSLFLFVSVVILDAPGCSAVCALCFGVFQQEKTG